MSSSTRLPAGLPPQPDVTDLLDNIPVGVYRATPDGRILYANAAFAAMLGAPSAEQLLGRNLSDRPEALGYSRQQFQADLENSGEVRGREAVWLHPDGVTTIVRESAKAVRAADGTVLYYDGTLEDITASAEFGTAYHALFEANPQPMWIHDCEDLKFLAVNDAALRMYGYTRAEFLSMTLPDIRPAGEREFVRPMPAGAARPWECYGTWIHQRKDGRLMEVEISSGTLLFGGRNARFILAQDVTGRNAARRALEESESYFRAITDNVLDIITIVDPDLTVNYTSPSMERVLGYRPEERKGKSALELVHPGDREALRLFADRVRTDPEALATEFRMLHVDGSWRTLQIVAKSLLHDPIIRGIVVYARDITDRRREQEALKESEQRLRLAQEAGDVGIWELDFESFAADYSSEAMALFGLPAVPGRMDHEQWLNCLHPDDRQRIDMTAARTMHTMMPVEAEYRVVWPDHSVHWLFAKAELRRDQAGHAKGLIGVMIDITSRKHVEQELQRARDAAIEAAEIKDQFLATVSHEIRTPMNAILGLAGLLLDSSLSNDQRTDLETLRASGLHLLDIINDLLDLSKSDAGKLRVENLPFDVAACVNGVAELLEPEANSKGLMLTVRQPHGPLWMYGDAGRVRQVLLNLTSNAIKFTEAGRICIDVELRDTPEGSVLRMIVSDTGPGIPESLQPRLFERFVQGDNRSNRRFPGAGLGLAISRRLAEAMDGSIGMTTEVPLGSTFWVQLPFQPAPPQNNVAPATAGVAMYQPEHRVLVVEDNAVNRKVLVRLLEKRGFTVDIAGHGGEAVDLWRQFTYQLIFMDCQMPEIDGYEASRRIRTEECGGAHVPIVAVTAHSGADEQVRCSRSGMDAFLQKPFELEDLDAVLRRYVRLAPVPDHGLGF